ncbi:hypothetical protein PC39_02325 [Salinisphaera sp. PC39]
MSGIEPIGFLPAEWSAPPGVHAGTSTRAGGVSAGEYASFNLGDRAGDDPAAVAENRRRLRVGLNLVHEPRWLYQVHGTRVVPATPGPELPEADAAVAAAPGEVCAVLTADCLPVLLCDDGGTRVAAAHGGWRGLAGGILAETVAAMTVPPATVMAWLGPAIGPAAFEVGDEVRAAFVARDPDHAAAFAPGAAPGKHQADIYALARRELARAGVARVYGGGRCTVTEADTFYSYRRQGGECGRMASLIWRD